MIQANDGQIGGTHYKDAAVECPECGREIQHWDIAWMLNWNIFQYMITKHLWRNKTDRLEDARKAHHETAKYVEMLEREEEKVRFLGDATPSYVNQD